VVGARLAEHPDVRKIAFTGSTEVGKSVMRAAAGNVKKVTLELGGKGANIVFDDADLDNAVAWSIRAIFSNAGQVCLAGSRLYVQRGIYAEFTDRFVAAAKALVAGDPKDGATQLGPLASEQHYRKVRSTWTASRPTAARSGPAASATAGWCCPRWWRTPRRPCASAARRCSARW
jgi:aminomuconate-semialdehyde/2-hydroxymuconate-6-semialdehyde dehydrogenase